MGKGRHKRKTHVEPTQESQSGIPRSMVIKMGDPKRKPTKALSALVRDFRTIMQPHTAARLKERRSNKLKDYFVMAGPLGVTNFFIFSQSLSGNTTLRIGRTPRGPTLYFRVNSYSLSRDIQRVQARPHALTPQSPELQHPPVLVMNGFSAEKTSDANALLTSMFQNMLPTIKVDANMSLGGVRRVLLLNRDPESGFIELRHYAVVTRIVGTSKAIKKLEAAARGQRALPDLRELESMAQYIDDMTGSESEAEDELIPQGPAEGISQPTITQKVKKAVRLVEVGPRMNLSLMKVEEGLCSGKTIYHSLVTRTAKESLLLEQKHRSKDNERAKRRKIQEENVRRKREAQEARGSRRQRGLERMRQRDGSQNNEDNGGNDAENEENEENARNMSNEPEDVENMNDYALEAELAHRKKRDGDDEMLDDSE